MNNDKEKRLDEMLDVALAEYGNAEPLHGIEERVLARLQDSPVRRWVPWLRWGVVAAATIVVALMVIMRNAEQPKPVPVTAKQQPAMTAPQPQVAPVVPAQQAQQVAPAVPARAERPHTMAQVKSRQQSGQPPVILAVTQSRLPRRDVFPTPTPPSMEEILLARHVRTTPSDVVLAEAEREPLKFHYDDVPVPATHAGPQKEDSTK